VPLLGLFPQLLLPGDLLAQVLDFLFGLVAGEAGGAAGREQCGLRAELLEEFLFLEGEQSLHFQISITDIKSQTRGSSLAVSLSACSAAVEWDWE
jgi:hypothetical protein